MSDIGFWLVIGFVGGLAGFGYGFIVRKHRDLVASIPTSKIRSAAMGMVEVSGKAGSCGNLHRSPFCGKEAVYLEYEVTLHRHKRSTVTLAKFKSDDPFLVEDETGKALVTLEGADLRFDHDHSRSLGPFGIGTGVDELRRGLEILGVKAPSVLGGTVQCQETYILPGDTVYVLGFARSLNEDSAAASVDAPALMLTKEKGQYFCVSDKDEKNVLGSLNVELGLCQYFAPAMSAVCLYFLMGIFHP